MADRTAVWMAAAFRSAAHVDTPEASAFPPDIVEREAEDLRELEEMGAVVLTREDPDYPERLRDGGPLVLSVAGKRSLLNEEGVEVFAKYRGEEGERLMDALDAGTRVLLVLSKGLLKARSLLRALHEPLENGCVALVSAEPPRASWGPVRDVRRDALCAKLDPNG